jgi:uncharacterized RDD family membrane protein YckC
MNPESTAADENPFSVKDAASGALDGESDELRLATLTERFGAFLIDFALQWVGLGFVWAITEAVTNPLEWAPPTVGGGYLVMLVAVNVYLLATRAQSVGKLALGIHIVRADYSPVDSGRMFGLRVALTWFLSNFPCLGPVYFLADSLTILFNERRQCLHDFIADTVVVKRKKLYE